MHPIVQSVYVCLVLVGLGGWLLLRRAGTNADRLALRPAPVPGAARLAAVQSLPLPIGLVEWLSPARAERMRQVALLAGDTRSPITLSDQGAASLQQVILFLALLVYFLALRTLRPKTRRFSPWSPVSSPWWGPARPCTGCSSFSGRSWVVPLAEHLAAGRAGHDHLQEPVRGPAQPAPAGGLRHGGGRPEPDLHGGHPAVVPPIRPDAAQPEPREPAGRALPAGRGPRSWPALFFPLSRGGIIAMLVVLFTLDLTLPLSRRTKLVVAGSARLSGGLRSAARPGHGREPIQRHRPVGPETG